MGIPGFTDAHRHLLENMCNTAVVTFLPLHEWKVGETWPGVVDVLWWSLGSHLFRLYPHLNF